MEYILENLNFILLVLASMAISVLGLLVYFSNKKSVTNKVFLLFCIVGILYAVINHASYTVSSKELVLWFLRLVLFSSLWYSFFLLQLFYVFPKEEFSFSKKFKFILIPIVALVSVSTLTPFVFTNIEKLAPAGEVTNPERGPGIVVYAILTFYLVAYGMYVLFDKTRNAQGLEKMQLKLVLFGSIVTYSMFILFNMILPVAFNNLKFIPFAPFFFIPFIFLTYYSIVKYRLLNIKVITTELLTFVIWLFVLGRILSTNIRSERILESILLFILVFFGILLIRSVRREVEQREKLSKLTAELEQKTEMLEDLSSINNHQQRTPLTVIKGGIDMIENSKLTKQQQQEIFSQMKDRVERMLHTLTEFSVGFSPKFKSVSPIPAKGELEPAVRMIYDEHFELEKARQRRNPKYKKLEFAYHQPEKAFPPVWFDKDNTLHILSNLLDNAVSYSDNGTIEVSFDIDNDFAIVKIKDNGMGVTGEEKKIIFEKAKRSERAKKRYAFGSGLGLFLARQIAEESGGSLDVESEGVGKGSTFVLKLPLYKGQDQKKQLTETGGQKD